MGTHCRNKNGVGRVQRRAVLSSWFQKERDVNKCTAADAVRKLVLGFSRARLTLAAISAQYSSEDTRRGPYLVCRFRRLPSQSREGGLFAETGRSRLREERLLQL